MLKTESSPNISSVPEIGANVLRHEGEAVLALAAELDRSESDLHTAFARAVKELSVPPNRRVIVTGMGKSGHVGRKIAATLASTGTPALFVHPAEASHGDLGMIVPGDVVLALSNSGKSRELNVVVDYAKRRDIPLVVITSNKRSPLGEAADIALVLPKVPEACALGLAPTTSTTMALALGDALAVAAMQVKGFTKADFGGFHPGGSLGNVLQRVSEIMHADKKVPLVGKDTKSGDAVSVMIKKGLGCVGVVDKEGQLVGVITDSDLLKHIDSNRFAKMAARELMARQPVSVRSSTLMAEALRLIEEGDVEQIFVTDEKHRPIGLVHVRDLLHAKVA